MTRAGFPATMHRSGDICRNDSAGADNRPVANGHTCDNGDVSADPNSLPRSQHGHRFWRILDRGMLAKHVA